MDAQVKQGGENMIQQYSNGPTRDKKLLAEAQQMLADSKAKIEYIKMRIMKVKQSQEEDRGGSESRAKGKFRTRTIKEHVQQNSLRRRFEIESIALWINVFLEEK